MLPETLAEQAHQTMAPGAEQRCDVAGDACVRKCCHTAHVDKQRGAIPDVPSSDAQ